MEQLPQATNYNKFKKHQEEEVMQKQKEEAQHIEGRIKLMDSNDPRIEWLKDIMEILRTVNCESSDFLNNVFRIRSFTLEHMEYILKFFYKYTNVQIDREQGRLGLISFVKSRGELDDKKIYLVIVLEKDKTHVHRYRKFGTEYEARAYLSLYC